MVTKRKKKTRSDQPKRTETIIASSSGRGRVINRLLVLEKLKPYFQIGLDISRACNAYNTRARDEFLQAFAMKKTKRTEPDYISKKTVQTWSANDDAVQSLIDSWKDTTNVLARQSWIKKIQTGDYTASKDWLERSEKKDFSPKSEVGFTDPEGKSVTPIIYLPDNGRT